VIDWRERVDDLTHHLRSVYQIDDSEAVEILLSGLVECPRVQPVWLVLETGWYSRDCGPGWFSFGPQWDPWSMGKIRAMRPRAANELITGWLNEPSVPRLLVEPDWQQFHHPGRISEIVALLARSLHVRIVTPRTTGALAVDDREQERRADTLAALTRAVIEDRVSARSADPPVFKQPPNFLYHAELLQRLAPWYPDWNLLLGALAAIATRHAYLFNRKETNEDDWKIMARLAADSVPVWVHNLVHYLEQNPAADPGAPSATPRSQVQ
jgi:hypothetical protein